MASDEHFFYTMNSVELVTSLISNCMCRKILHGSNPTFKILILHQDVLKLDQSSLVYLSYLAYLSSLIWLSKSRMYIHVFV